jgi:hypothetical protein
MGYLRSLSVALLVILSVVAGGALAVRRDLLAPPVTPGMRSHRHHIRWPSAVHGIGAASRTGRN